MNKISESSHVSRKQKELRNSLFLELFLLLNKLVPHLIRDYLTDFSELSDKGSFLKKVKNMKVAMPRVI